MKKGIINILLLFMAFTGFCQQFEITTIEQTPEDLIVHYDLIDTTRDRTYTVYLYLLTDSTIAPVKHASGDVGLEVRPGVYKSIRWNAKKELGASFKGSVQLEVRGKVYVPFIEFEGFPSNQPLKRGKSYDFAWTGKSSSNILEFKLYRGGELTAVLPEVANTGNAKIEMPKSVKPGKYRFYITDSRNKDQEVHSPVFVIKPAIPWPLKVIPAALLGSGATFLILNANKEDPPGVENPPDIPDN